MFRVGDKVRLKNKMTLVGVVKRIIQNAPHEPVILDILWDGQRYADSWYCDRIEKVNSVKNLPGNPIERKSC